MASAQIRVARRSQLCARSSQLCPASSHADRTTPPPVGQAESHCLSGCLCLLQAPTVRACACAQLSGTAPGARSQPRVCCCLRDSQLFPGRARAAGSARPRAPMLGCTARGLPAATPACAQHSRRGASGRSHLACRAARERGEAVSRREVAAVALALLPCCQLAPAGRAEASVLPSGADDAWAAIGGGPADLVFPLEFLGEWTVRGHGLGQRVANLPHSPLNASGDVHAGVGEHSLGCGVRY